MHLPSLPSFSTQYIHCSTSLVLLHLIARNTSPAFEAYILNEEDLMNNSAQMLQQKEVRMKCEGTLDNLLPLIALNSFI